MDTNGITVEVVYPLPYEQLIFKASIPTGSTVAEGIQASGILEHYPELDWQALDTGIFGKLVPATTVLRERDRIEIYRPLIADPKAVRKKRAAAGKKMKKGGSDAAAN
ncbi:MAG: RnfH family protein [Proteobacteria bacterium]|nr:MAG: RnfH family protein [Pseudomonadota bacterium]